MAGIPFSVHPLASSWASWAISAGVGRDLVAAIHRLLMNYLQPLLCGSLNRFILLDNSNHNILILRFLRDFLQERVTFPVKPQGDLKAGRFGEFPNGRDCRSPNRCDRRVR